MMRLPDAVRQAPVSPQVLTFLAVGGAGYVVDVVAFNLLRSTATLGAWDPSVARILAVGAAMVVTYLGNSLFTWRGEGTSNRRREVSLFILFNLVGLGISVLTLTISHDVLGLTSRMADNISANVVGLALGTLFRYWSYKTFVFTHTGAGVSLAHVAPADVEPVRTMEQSKGSGPAMRLGSMTSAVLLVAVFALTGCGSQGSPASTNNGDAASTKVADVQADAETQPMQHPKDSADDPAIWVDTQDPAKSMVIGNDKQGALETYNLDGSLVQRIVAPTKFWGNVDVRQGVELGAGTADVVAAANDGLRVFAVDPTTRKLSPITVNGAALETGGGEGVCLYDRPGGALSVFMVNISGDTRQFALEDDGTGHLSAKQVRHFKIESEAEGCVVDDENRALYIDEENVGTWKYGADPSSGSERTMVDRVKPKGHQTPDIEGITLVDDGAGNGLIIASSQGQGDEKSYFSVFDRKTGAYRSSFRIVDGDKADGCSHTDGVAATSRSLGPDFPDGVFVCQDNDNTAPGQAGNQDFKLTRLEKIRP
jgi:myo-inositol-hexaphosphate 3-phosphohydrolase/putative flippase GtrA